MCGTSACTTSFVAEPKHFTDPFWRGVQFGYDDVEPQSFKGLQPRAQFGPEVAWVVWRNYEPLVIY